ncbi:hypothetical protein CBEIBR21_19535 [Clostridium beijerinckii]|uniref:Uncharacterized protein n=1 Tax=Clostridium beijerinckii TaxID=1520 RepID=A0A1S9N2N7_CLOBE|nr:efflux RND transporter periplasmic adaptor subunit [Clostridium beijerinckii]OOP71787.1 hypothetical protein CBEIBR21_19535 [Clostridium beijerinckii]
MIRVQLIEYTKRKKLTGKLLITFIVMMALLTFFSNTINNFTLSRITVDTAVSGALIKEISGKGTVTANSIFEQYIDVGNNLLVKNVNVKLNDTVKEGQPIITLDIGDIKSSLQDENSKYRQMQIVIDKLNDSSNLLKLNNDIETALKNKNQKSKSYQDIKTLFDSDFETANNLQNAKADMDEAERNYNLAVQTKEAYIKTNQEDIQNAQLNLEIEARKIDSLNKQIANGGVYTAPSDGVITELNFNEGSLANSSKALFKLAETSGGFQVSISVNSDLVTFVKSGDSVDVDITSLEDKIIAGKVSQIKADSKNGDNKELIIDLNDPDLQGGENAEVNIIKQTKQYSTLVPNSAVYTDNNGTYVFSVIEKEGPLGKESFVKRVDIIVEDSDGTNSAVIKGLDSRDKIVAKSTKSLSDGDRAVVEK